MSPFSRKKVYCGEIPVSRVKGTIPFSQNQGTLDMQVLSINVRDERQLKAFIGLSFENLIHREEAFSKAYEARKEKAYKEGKAQGERQRAPGGGKKGTLRTIRDTVVFLLYYLKVYPRVSKTAIFGPNSLTGFWIQDVKAVSLMPGGPALSGK